MFYWDILTLEGGTDWLSQDIGTQLSLYAAHSPRRQQISKLVQFQCALPVGECKMEGYGFCDITSENVYWGKIT
jgi:hypothetical protein